MLLRQKHAHDARAQASLHDQRETSSLAMLPKAGESIKRRVMPRDAAFAPLIRLDFGRARRRCLGMVHASRPAVPLFRPRARHTRAHPHPDQCALAYLETNTCRSSTNALARSKVRCVKLCPHVRSKSMHCSSTAIYGTAGAGARCSTACRCLGTRLCGVGACPLSIWSSCSTVRARCPSSCS